MPATEQFWPHRMRWRLRGAAWLWPAYAGAVLVDAALLHFLPPVGPDQQIDAPTLLNVFGDLILAAFVNWMLLALVAPWLARRLVARAQAAHGEEPEPPYEVTLGRTAAILMAVGALGLVVVGLGNRPVIVSETQATEANARTVRDWVFNHGTAEMRRNLETANTVRKGPGLFRTCIAHDNRREAFCFYVNTNNDPPTIHRDPDATPNSEAVNR